jgi:protein SCO1/2
LAAAAALAALLPFAAWSSPTETHPATGLVLQIKDGNKLVVSCSEIPNYMPAMTMTFDVANPAELSRIRPGMMIDFTLVVDQASSHIEKIAEHRFHSTEEKPLQVERMKLAAEAFPPPPGAPKMLEPGQKLPEFTLIDQHRQPVKSSDFAGKVVAVSFMYSHCSSPEFCLRMTNNLGLVAKRFSDRLGKDLVLLTITFDPMNDTPEVMARYASTWKASEKGWYFLTGPPEDVKRVCLLFGMDFWAQMEMIVHSMHTAVFDRNGVLVTNLEGNDFSGEQLGNLIQTVLDRPR